MSLCVCMCEGTINQVKGDTMSQCQLSCHVFPIDCEAGCLLSVSSDVKSDDSRVCEHLLARGHCRAQRLIYLHNYILPKTLPCTIGSTLSQSYNIIIILYLQGCVNTHDHMHEHAQSSKVHDLSHLYICTPTGV